MELSYTTFIMITLGSAAIQVFSSLYIWQHRTVPGATGLFGVQLGGWVRMLFFAIELSSSNMLVKQVANNMRITGIIIGALFLLIFALQYTGRQDWLTGRRLYLILVPSILVLIILWTNGWHHMFWESYPVTPKDGFLIPIRIYGSLFWIQFVNSLSQVFASFAILIYAAIITKTIYRIQATVVFLSVSPLLLGDILFTLKLFPNLMVNPSALGYAFGSILLTWVLVRYRLVDLVPIAHHILVQSMSDGMLVLDKQQRIVDLNPAAEHFAGIPLQTAIGKPASMLLPESDTWLSNLEQSGNTYTELSRSDGTTSHLYEAQSSPITSRKGDLTGWVIVLRDITARKMAEESLKKARDAAEAANQAKSVFLANMSHEFRTPLNAILGFTQILSAEHGLAPKHYEYLAIIQRGGEHLLTLISSILDMSKIEAGRTTIQTTTFNLYEMLDTLEALFQERAEAKQLALRIHCAQDVPIRIITDEVKLRQVFINLLSNAIKFTDRGHVHLDVAQVATPQKPTDSHQYLSTITLQCIVSDTGPGVAPAQLEEIFQPFVQGTTTHQAQGTGLGLAISRSFVELMGGTITVQSELGQGTTFVVTIPVAVPPDGTFLLEKSVRRTDQQVVALVPGQRTYRILLVDDQWSNRQLLVSMLSFDGIVLREAEDGQAAVELWKTWEPDAILMDIRMPVLNGYEAARHIRAMSDKKQPVIIAITASILAEDRGEVFASGCDALLFKPFHSHTLFDLLHSHLGLAVTYGDAPQPQEDAPQSLSQDRLAAIPLALWDKLEHAVLLGNNAQILSVAKEMHPYEPTIASIIQQVAYAFDYAEISHLVTQAKQVWHT